MPIRAERLDDVLLLTIERPERRNALDLDLWHALRDACVGADGVRAVVLTGAGGHFCAGMDLNADNPLVAQIAPAVFEGREGPAYATIRELKECVGALADVQVPTFAAIEGACLGSGLEVALACDVRIAARNATIGIPEVAVGMVPDVGGCARLTRLVGPGRAADLIVTGRRIDGDEAYRLGVVERVVEPGEALNVALAAARQAAANAPVAVRMALRVVRVAPDLGLDEALSTETQAGVVALTSGEPAEGLAAFAERRAPRWPA